MHELFLHPTGADPHLSFAAHGLEQHVLAETHTADG